MTNPASTPTAAQTTALQTAIAQCMTAGWRLESQSPFTATMVSGGSHVSHGWHAFLTLVSCGLWSPIWIYSAWSVRVKRLMVAADPEGNVTYPVVVTSR